MMRALRRGLLALVTIGLLAAIGVGAAAWWWLDQPLKLAGPTAELSIESGMPVRGIAQGWVDAGVQTQPMLLYEWFRWSGQARQIKAGSYEIAAGTTPVQLLRKMVRGDEAQAAVRLIEGWTFRQFRAELARAEALKPTTATMTEAELMAAIGAPGKLAEGRFFPDTYAYSKGATDLAVLQRAYRAMQQRLDAAWAERAPDTPLASAEEALTLASIVEKETGQSADRGKVAAVFVNRLRVNMPLQTDPTVIYGLGASFDGNLRKRDLLADTPYNTYTRAGLPPTPISMPGKASLLATVRPEASKALFFVSRGDGSSEFSETLADHNRAVNRYQRGGAKPAMTAPTHAGFITFEGIDGAGKSTHIEGIAQRLRLRGHTVVRTREPGGTPLAETLRELVLHQPMDALTEALLIFAARRDHLRACIEPALARGDVVLCDRFTDATFAYQGAGRGFDLTVLHTLESWVQSTAETLRQPDLTLWFDLDPAIAAERVAQAREKDRFEQQDLDFFSRVRDGYRARLDAEPQRFVRIDASAARDAVAAQIEAALEARGW